MSLFSELAMILSLAQTNPLMFGMVADSPGMTEQLELLGRLKEFVETNQDDLKRKQRDDWIHWVGQYRYEKKARIFLWLLQKRLVQHIN